MSKLAGKSIMITGGAQGIGEGIARRLAADGASVAIADLKIDQAKEVAESLKAEGAKAIGVQVDVADRGQVQAAIKKVVDSFGRLDVLFNNAGFNKPLPFLDVDENNFNSIMRVNAWGVMVGTQEGAKQMIAQGDGGKIINTASIAGKVGEQIATIYCASKACVISLTQAGAEALGKYNITVNSFSPGFVKTPLWDGLDKDLISAGYRDEPNAVDHLAKTKAILGRVSTPDDLVGATTFLASSRSDYITGQNLMVDGGVRLI